MNGSGELALGVIAAATAIMALVQIGALIMLARVATQVRDIASTIIDLSDENERWRIIREGAIPADEISNFFAQG